jgi:hypothetical protein
MNNGHILLKAGVKLPLMPNFVEVTTVVPASLDDAVASNGGLRVDVGALDDDALQDFCNAWTIAFVQHAKSRRKAPSEPRT